MHGIYRLLADKEHIYGAEIEVIIEWKRCEAVVCRVLAGIKLDVADKQLAGGHMAASRASRNFLTMTVLPLYWMIWHDRPTSLPPPRQRNMSSSEGSTGSSWAAAFIADAFRLDAMVAL